MERIGSGTRGGTGNVKRDGDGKFNDVLPFSLLRRRKSAFPVSHQNSVHPMAALVSSPNRCIQPLSSRMLPQRLLCAISTPLGRTEVQHEDSVSGPCRSIATLGPY